MELPVVPNCVYVVKNSNHPIQNPSIRHAHLLHVYTRNRTSNKQLCRMPINKFLNTDVMQCYDGEEWQTPSQVKEEAPFQNTRSVRKRNTADPDEVRYRRLCWTDWKKVSFGQQGSQESRQLVGAWGRKLRHLQCFEPLLDNNWWRHGRLYVYCSTVICGMFRSV
jgi:hypothetical protein